MYHSSAHFRKGNRMPNVTIGATVVEVPAGTRLVNVIEDAGVMIGHRCGGKSRCTTCRVQFVSG